MSERVIPKEKLSAYQRWELHSLDSATPPAGVEPAAAAGDAPGASAPPAAEVALPTAEELERIQQQAWQEGYDAGWREGRARGDEAAGRMNALLEALTAALARLDRELERDLLGLSLDLVRHLLRQTLEMRPEAVLPVVREAIATLPQANQVVTLVLHPDDAELVRRDFELDPPLERWRIREDPHLERGGVRVETAHSDIDATLGARWHRLVAALGRDDLKL